MKKFLYLIFAIGLTLTACGTAQTQIASTTATSTPTITPTATQTPLPPTSTITPLPTIPTFTPTFDVSTIVTVTPAEKAECPKENAEINPNFNIPDSFSCAQNGMEGIECLATGLNEKILDYLNSGGSIKSLLNNYYRSDHSRPDLRTHFLKDVTGDTIPELILYDFVIFYKPIIFYCNQGIYKQFILEPHESTGFSIAIREIKDLNQNGIPEILFTFLGCSGSWCFGVSTFEWNGKTFVDESLSAGMWGVKTFSLNDIDHNGTTEIILTGDAPGICCVDLMTPWRYQTVTYTWDGSNYSESYITFDKAKYRFQAVQDGDREILFGNYEIAKAYYQETILNKNLDWWSSQRQIDTMIKIGNEGYSASGTPAPGIPDPAEYPSLAAYAYYRIILLQLIQGQEIEASTTYQTLQDTFGNDAYAAPYIEMATAFWESYQSTQKMYDGCAAAIQYAGEHPEILIPLGSDYHGSQSHIYNPEDVCPFR